MTEIRDFMTLYNNGHMLKKRLAYNLWQLKNQNSLTSSNKGQVITSLEHKINCRYDRDMNTSRSNRIFDLNCIAIKSDWQEFN